jgi:hypothetical protein
VKGKRAVVAAGGRDRPAVRAAQRVPERAKALAEKAPARRGPGVALEPLGGTYTDEGVTHRYVTLAIGWLRAWPH